MNSELKAALERAVREWDRYNPDITTDGIVQDVNRMADAARILLSALDQGEAVPAPASSGGER